MEELGRADGDAWTWSESRDRGGTETISIAFLSLEGNSLDIRVNSKEREAKVRDRVEGLLGDLVASVERVEEALDLDRMKDRAASQPLDDERSELPFELQQRVVHEMMTKHYRRWLDEPVPALEGMTPRRAAADRQRRHQVISLLKQIEADSRRRPADDPMASFDFRWLWRELGLKR
jgi:hypothetical protein